MAAPSESTAGSPSRVDVDKPFNVCGCGQLWVPVNYAVCYNVIWPQAQYEALFMHYLRLISHSDPPD